MQMDEILSGAQFVVDHVTGKKIAVLIDYAMWEELLTLLEDHEDAGEIRKLREASEKPILGEQAEVDLGLSDRTLRPFGLCAGEFMVPDDFDAPLPEYVIEEFEGRR